MYSFRGDVGDASTPTGKLIQANDGALYGLSAAGGNRNHGTLFRVTLDGNASVVHSFADRVVGSLVQGNDGAIYGMSSGGAPGVFQLK